MKINRINLNIAYLKIIDVTRLFYRLIRPFLGPNYCCRYVPTCSRYAFESLKRHGPVKGAFLSIKRILKCHPLSPGGYDPVPESSPKIVES
jgi:putative membrane protein insertion efficiency factor